MSKYKHSIFNIRCFSRDKKNILLFNTLTTRLLKIPSELDLELSTALQTGGGDIRLFSKLCEGGYLVTEDTNEQDIILAKHKIAQNMNHAFLSILTTLDCNMACPYCFEKKRNEYMSRKDGSSIVKYIAMLPDSVKFLTLDWYGGEPLMNYELICWLQPQILETVESKGILANYSMTTNGTLLSQERIYRLVNMGIQSFQITLDGPPAIHDSRRKLLSGQFSFGGILEHIKLASNLAHVIIRVNVDKNNIRHLYELIDILREAKLYRNTHLTFSEITPVGGIQDDNTFSVREFAQKIQPIEDYAISQGFVIPVAPKDIAEYCPVDSASEFMIIPGLSVFKCGESYVAEEESIGKLTETGEMLLNKKYDKWRGKEVLTDPQCSSCVYLPQCMGGCSLKKIFHKNDWCPKEKYNLEWYVQCLFEQRKIQGTVGLLKKHFAF